VDDQATTWPAEASCSPEGLLSVVDDLEADPGATVFVGDSERDAETARRAGTEFAWASEFDQRRYRA